MRKASIIIMTNMFVMTLLISVSGHCNEPAFDARPDSIPQVRHPISAADIPDPLKIWIPWVMENVTGYGCTQINDALQCSWPSTLTLRLTDRGGTFEQNVVMNTSQYLLLPGSTTNWPTDVQANGTPVPVISHHGAPMIELPAGRHRLQGAFHWQYLPEGLNVPADYALIELAINGDPISSVQRDPNGRIWLKKTTQQSAGEPALSLEVFRRIADGVPMTVQTHIVVHSSGKSGEVTLTKALLKGTVPLNVAAELPVRLTPDGDLKIQIRGGSWHVTIDAIVNQKTDAFTAPHHPSPWPDTEIWVFEPNEQIRQTELRGLSGIDPGRTNLKEEWKSLAAYSAAAGDTLTIHTTRRGESSPPPDRLMLNRRIWLDMDGNGCTIADTITGTLSRTDRLDFTQDGALGHARINGDDQVITTNPSTRKAGVEIRHSSLRMEAESRLDHRPDTMTAVGWQTDVQQLNAQLNLPPGWNLIAARGIDEVPGTWWDTWTLFGFFFVLLAAIATGRLTKWYYGILTLITLVLLHTAAPIEFVAFVGLPLLTGLALIKAVPKSRLRAGVIIAWSVFALIMVAAAIPFSVDQVRQGLYPQLEKEYYSPDFSISAAPKEDAYRFGEADKNVEAADEIELQMAKQEAAAPEDAEMDQGDLPAMKQQAVFSQKDGTLRREMRGGSSAGLLDDLAANSSGYKSKNMRKAVLQQDPEAVVQTGPGVPDWRWNAFHLSWQGPVDKNHEIRLYLTGPVTHLVLSVFRVILLALLAAVLLLETFRSIQSPPSHGPSIRLPGKKGAAAAAGSVGAMLALMIAPSLHAQIPEHQLVELENRLTRTPSCAPDCVETAALDVAVQDGAVVMTATVHAGALSAWPLPGPAANWIPSTVSVDGKTDTALRLQPDGFIYLQLAKGIHEVVLRGKMKNENLLTVEFTNQPHMGRITADAYTVTGLRENGQFDTSIAISRKFEAASDTISEGGDTSYTPWLQVSRTIDFGIPWSIHTIVTRVSPTGAPLMFRIPLVDGESITASDLEAKDGYVSVPFGRDETQVEWSSVLTEKSTLTLRAPKGENWTETWHVQCSPIWQCDTKGTPPMQNRIEHKVYQPWPGETLSIQTRRPKAVKGQTVTIERARLKVSPGLRLSENTLEMTVRSSQGGVQQLTLPKGAAIQSLAVNGAKRPFKQKNSKLEIALRPGVQNIVLSWQQKGGMRTVFDAPRIQVGGAVANFHLTLHMPANRWLIGVMGPSWGPAVLFWGYLLTILIVSFFILGRTPRSHLKGWQWALLSLGLTQVPIGVALIIVAWFFLVHWRSTNPLKNTMYIWHNLLQTGVGIWTFMALICLLGAVYNGLAVQPDMQVSGLGSSNGVLNWYTDHMTNQSPEAKVWSVPIIFWKGVMLAWALWLSYSLIAWSKWGFQSFSQGDLWRNPPPREQNGTESSNK